MTSSFPSDDEPVDGPSCYILLTGFTSVSIYKELASLKLNATALVKIKNVDILSEVDDGTALDTVTGKDTIYISHYM